MFRNRSAKHRASVSVSYVSRALLTIYRNPKGEYMCFGYRSSKRPVSPEWAR